MLKNVFVWIIIIVLIINAILPIFYRIRQIYKEKKINKKIELLAAGVEEMTPKRFFEMRNYSSGGRGRAKYALSKNFKGVYIIHNKTKDLYYVGQAQKILDRVNSHFTGKGNGDVYADYKYGDEFTIRMIALKNSDYKTLNSLERDTIKKYNAVTKGYNKQQGNKK